MTPNEKHVEILIKVTGTIDIVIKQNKYFITVVEALTAMQTLQEEHDKQIEAAFDLHRTLEAAIAQLRGERLLHLNNIKEICLKELTYPLSQGIKSRGAAMIIDDYIKENEL